MKIFRIIRISVVWMGLLIVLSGCLDKAYYGTGNHFGDKWEAVTEKNAPAETLFSRFYFLKQLPQEKKENEYQKD